VWNRPSACGHRERQTYEAWITFRVLHSHVVPTTVGQETQEIPLSDWSKNEGQVTGLCGNRFLWPGPHQNRQAQSRPRSPGRKKEEDHRNDESNGHRHDRKSRPAPVRGYMPVSGIESEILSRRLPNIHREAQASHTIQDKACTNIREHCKNHRNCEEADSGSHEEVPQHDHILLPNRPRHSPVKYHPKEGKL
jgi:hypothetical protein